MSKDEFKPTIPWPAPSSEGGKARYRAQRNKYGGSEAPSAHLDNMPNAAQDAMTLALAKERDLERMMNEGLIKGNSPEARQMRTEIKQLKAQAGQSSELPSAINIEATQAAGMTKSENLRPEDTDTGQHRKTSIHGTK